VSFLASIEAPELTYVGLLTGDPSTTISTRSLTVPGGVTTLALLPSCTATIENGDQTTADPGIRLAAFQQAFGDHGAFATVCQSDYSTALTTFAQGIEAMTSPCLAGPISTADTEPDEPGLHPPCTIADVQNLDTPAQTETVIPPCQMQDATTPVAGQVTCWWVERSPECSATPTGLLMNFVRSRVPAAGTVTQISCLPAAGS
jgi:hypothetical protein